MLDSSSWLWSSQAHVVIALFEQPPPLLRLSSAFEFYFILRSQLSGIIEKLFFGRIQFLKKHNLLHSQLIYFSGLQAVAFFLTWFQHKFCHLIFSVGLHEALPISKYNFHFVYLYVL